MNAIPLDQRLIVALDVDTLDQALSLCDRLKERTKSFKVGSQLFTACGPSVVTCLKQRGLGVFLDLQHQVFALEGVPALLEISALVSAAVY